MKKTYIKPAIDCIQLMEATHLLDWTIDQGPYGDARGIDFDSDDDDSGLNFSTGLNLWDE